MAARVAVAQRSIRLQGRTATELNQTVGVSGEIFFDTTNQGLRIFPTAGTTSVTLSTKAYVDTQIANLTGGAPETLNTLTELATALQNQTVSAAVLESIAAKANSADLAPVAFSGNYASLTNRPSIPLPQVSTDWNATTGITRILNKPTNVSAFTNDAGYVDATAIAGKQDILVSGTNIKTINSTPVLGSGNITVQATLVSGTNIKTINGTSLLGSGNLSITGGGGDTLPSQVGNSGKYLTTNGSVLSWATVSGGGSGGTAYDQSLNTTNDVLFNSVTSTIGFSCISVGVPTVLGSAELYLTATNRVSIRTGVLNVSSLTAEKKATIGLSDGDIYITSTDGELKAFSQGKDASIMLRVSAPATSIGAAGDIPGLFAYNSSYFYTCTDFYDGTTAIWKRVALTSW